TPESRICRTVQSTSAGEVPETYQFGTQPARVPARSVTSSSRNASTLSNIPAEGQYAGPPTATTRATRSGCRTASSVANSAPIDEPTSTGVSRSSVSRTPSTSDTAPGIVLPADGRLDRPQPR